MNSLEFVLASCRSDPLKTSATSSSRAWPGRIGSTWIEQRKSQARLWKRRFRKVWGAPWRPLTESICGKAQRKIEMRNYEIMFIVNPNTPEDDIDKVNSQLESVITSGGGKIEKTEKMGKR